MIQRHSISIISTTRRFAFLTGLLVVLFPGIALAVTPIAHTDVVPYQRIEYGKSFNFGVVAFSKAGIDRVSFAISGQGYSGGTKSSSTMTLNTRVATTSPGAVYDGVWEYHVPIMASEFASNGTITVTPTVYGNDGGTRVLSGITLYVEGASDELPTKAWVDAGESDGTGTLNDENDPYPTIAAALSAIEAANGNCDYATVYLAEGSYNVSGLSPTTNNEWVTITKEASANINNVILRNVGISTSHLHMREVTLYDSTANNSAILRNQGSWIDHCRQIGAGRLAGDESNPVHIEYGYHTGNYIYDTMNGVMRHTQVILRGLKIEHISNDVMQNNLFAVNIRANDVDPTGTYPCPRYNNGDNCHADLFQSYQVRDVTYDNRILYNYVVTDAHYQGAFMRQENGSPSSNMALVNCFFELRGLISGGGFNALMGHWDHVLVWHSTFVGAGEPSHWAWATFLFDDEPSGYTLTNSSFIGNVFHRVTWGSGTNSGVFAIGNSSNNVASYNHFELGSTFIDTNSSTTYTTGDDAVDISTPGSATFGYPYPGRQIVNRLPSNLTGVLADAYGKQRDSFPDVGALEADSGAALPPLADPVCGDNVCEGSETSVTCPSDCVSSSPPPEGSIVASGVTASSDDGNVPANIIDDSLATRWSAEGDGQWIQLDLGDEYDLTHLLIAFYRGDQRTASFEINISTNQTTWHNVFTGNSTLSAQQQQYNVSGKARYVRIVGHGNTDSAWNSITEVDVFGPVVGGALKSPKNVE